MNFVMREELNEANYCINEARVRTNLEISPQKKPLARARAMFFKGVKEARGDEAKIRAFYGNLQTSFFAEVGP